MVNDERTIYDAVVEFTNNNGLTNIILIGENHSIRNIIIGGDNQERVYNG